MIHIFVNPLAGKGKALQVAALIEKTLQQKNIDFVLYTSQWPDNLQQCTEAWIVGGDGTLNYFINKYNPVKISLSIIKGGTGNDFAWQLYGNDTVHQQIEKVLSATPKSIDGAICNGKLFINSIGIGFDGEVLKSMNAIRYIGGHIGYLLLVIKKIFSFIEFSFDIQLEDKKIEGRFLIVNIANASRTGGGFKISPQAIINDGKLNLILCKPLSVLQRLRYLPVIEKGKHLQLPFISHQLIENATVICNNTAFAQLDGELIKAKSFEIKVLPDYFLFKY
jgi:YegS/Rv2252/BmrU family lipid kinase